MRRRAALRIPQASCDRYRGGRFSIRNPLRSIEPVALQALRRRCHSAHGILASPGRSLHGRGVRQGCNFGSRIAPGSIRRIDCVEMQLTVLSTSCVCGSWASFLTAFLQEIPEGGHGLRPEKIRLDSQIREIRRSPFEKKDYHANNIPTGSVGGAILSRKSSHDRLRP